MSQLPEIKGMWRGNTSSMMRLGTSHPPSFSNYYFQKWTPHIQSIQHFSTVTSFATCLSVHWFCYMHWFGIGLQWSCTEDHLRNTDSPSALWACVKFLCALSVIQRFYSRCIERNIIPDFSPLISIWDLTVLNLLFTLEVERATLMAVIKASWVIVSNTKHESIWEGECTVRIKMLHLKGKETNNETTGLIERERIHCIPEQMCIFLYPFG